MSNARSDVKIRLDRFPVKAQICIRQSAYYECVASPNQVVYFPPFFKTASSEQYQPLLRSDTDSAMVLKFHEFFFICLLRYPKDYAHTLSSSSSSSSSFAPRAFSAGGSGSAESVSALSLLNSKGFYSLIDGIPYMVLLHETLKELIPHEREDGRSRRSKDDSGTSSRGSERSSRNAASHLSPDVSLTANGELFLRLLAEYWIDSATLVRRNHAQGVNFKAQLNKTMVHYNSADPSNRHPLPTSILTLDNNSMSWGSATMQCTYIVLVRALSDPHLATQFATLAQANGAAFESAHLMANYAKSSGYTRAGSQMALQSSSVCPPALGLLQQPLFDMLRTVFSKKDGRNGSEMHAIAVECWLLYIQPWKAEDISRGVPLETVDKASSYSRQVWLPYIASNLHFYTTLLVIFLQSVCKTDLSVLESPGLVQLLLLEKVLLAFKPLMEDIHTLVDEFKAWYPEHSRDAGAVKAHLGSFGVQTPGSSFDGVISLPSLVSIRAQHHWLFPDANIDKLNDFGIVDVRDYAKLSALKIISMLNVALRDSKPKKILNIVEVVAGTLDMLLALDHWASGVSITKVLGILGITSINKTDTTLIDRISVDIEKVREITQCGEGDTESLAATQDTEVENDADADADVTDENTGLLKSHGRKLLLSGKKVPIDALRWFGDVLEMPCCSYEVHFLVQRLVTLSQSLNEKYALPRLPESAKWTWQRIGAHLNSYEEAGQIPVRAKYNELCRLMRFNLRIFAHVRVVSLVMLFVFSRKFAFSIFGLWNYTVLIHAGILCYLGTTILPSGYYTALTLVMALFLGSLLMKLIFF
eukprot:GSChrysophyteH1.ASY1.ANO1.1408.1 assembled CDS